MKTKIIGLVSICVCLIACQSKINNINDKGENNLPPPDYGNGTVWVVKFKQPEYKKHILVASPTQGESYLMMQSAYGGWVFGFTVPRVVQDLYGKAPYIELLDNYLLIDWKYYRVMRSTLIGKPSIITNKWEELDNLATTWPLENMYIKYPCEEIISIPIDSLNAYVGGNLTYWTAGMYHIIYLEVDDNRTYREEVIKEYQQYIPIGDSAYVEYKDVLNKMITEGENLSNHGKVWY